MKWFNNMKIFTKFLTTFLLIAVIAGVIGLVGIKNINLIGENDTLLYEENTLGVVYTARAIRAYQNVRYNILEAAVTKDTSVRQTSIDEISNYSAIVDEN